MKRFRKQWLLEMGFLRKEISSKIAVLFSQESNVNTIASNQRGDTTYYKRRGDYTSKLRFPW